VIDELAHAANMDPVAFRIQNVTQGESLALGQLNNQLLTVLNTVTSAANWKPRVTASNLSAANIVTGRGVAWSNVDSPKTYAQTAVVADIEVNKKTGKITVKHVYQAVSTVLAVYPGGIENQIVGGVTQIIIPWGALIRSRCKSAGFGTRLSLCTPRAVEPSIAETFCSPSLAAGPTLRR